MPSQEALMLEATKARYRARVEKANAGGQAVATKAGNQLFREAASAFQLSLEGLKAEILGALEEGKRIQGYRSFAITLFEELDVPTLSAIVTSTMVNSILSGTMPAAVAKIKEAINREVLFRKAVAVDKAKTKSILKAAEAHVSKQSWAPGKAAQWIRKAHLGADVYPHKELVRIILLMVEMWRVTTGLVEYKTSHEPTKVRGKYNKQTRIVPSGDVDKWLGEAHEFLQYQNPVRFPLLHEPKDWTSLWNGGYERLEHLKVPLVFGRGDTLRKLDKMTAETAPHVYEAFNALQRTAWEINPTCFEALTSIQAAGGGRAGLPYEEELDTSITVPEDMPKEEAAALRRQRSLKINRNRTNREAKWGLAFVVWQAKKILGRPHWYVMGADSRGRIYPQSSYLHPQGPDTQRGLLRFHRAMPIGTPEAEHWFLVHGANSWGHDKVPYEDRISWVESHRQEILEVAADPLSNQWWHEADAPFAFLAWCEEYAGYMDDGLAFESRIPVGMDGSNNGLQIYSLIGRDPEGARATNVRSSPVPQDIYAEVAEAATNILCDRAAGGCPLARAWLQWLPGGCVSRSMTKHPVMTLPYGVTKYSVNDALDDWYFEALYKRGDGVPVIKERPFAALMVLSSVIWKATQDAAGAAPRIQKWFTEASKILLSNNVAPSWVTPDGWQGHQSYTRFQKEEVNITLGPKYSWLRRHERSNTLKARFQSATKTPHKGQHARAIAPNIIHSLDATAMRMTVRALAQEGVVDMSMIHDSFAVHAAHTPVLARVLREQYARLFEGNILEDLASYWQSLLPDGVKLPDTPVRGDLDPRAVITSPYFFQ